MNYLRKNPCVERLLETVERFENDIDNTIPKRSYRVVIEVGDALPVSPQRDRKGLGIMHQVESSLKEMVRNLAVECNRPLPQQNNAPSLVEAENPGSVRSEAGIST